MITIYALRHGQSQANLDGVVAGHANSPLTPEGKEQARAAGQALQAQGISPTKIISSPLSRTLTTAQLVAHYTNIKPHDIVQDSLLIERHCGSFEGGSLETYLAANEAQTEARGVESLEHLELRAQQLLKKLLHTYPQETLLLVSHNGFLKMLQAVINHQPISSVQRSTTIPNATIIKLWPAK